MSLLEVLREARSLVSHPSSDFSWSSWENAREALAEIDGLIERVQSGSAPLDEIAILFAPAGPLQELSLASGWGDRFLALADRVDEAAASASRGQASFACSVCGKQAGVVELRGPELRRESFTGVLSQRVIAAGAGRLRAALGARDAGGLFELDPEYAPFYCPPCSASYCADHWERWDVFDEEFPSWHDSIRGRCPRGHERMLED